MRPDTFASAVLLATALTGLAGGAGAQETCAAGRISHIFVDNHGVFDTEEMDEDDSFLWAYELANTLHMTTRGEFIRKELLFEEGDCYDPVLLEESERLLRDYPTIARVDVFGLDQPDGTWHVIVDTRDEWTTKLNLNVAFEEGFEFRGISVAEENVLGQGYLVELFYRQRDEEKDLGGRLFTPRVFGTRLDADVKAGRTRNGAFFEEELFYPFLGEVSRFAFRQIYLRRDELFAYTSGPDEGFEHVLLPLEEERVEVTAAGRIGRPGNLTLFGLGISNETLEFPEFPGDVEMTVERNFGDTRTASEEITDQILEQTLHSGGTRFNLLFGQRNIRFVRREGLDALKGVQDVEVGTDVALTVGRTVSAFSAGENQPDDLYGRLRLFGGLAYGEIAGNVAVALEGRQIFAGGAQGGGWRDILGELDALLYWQPPTPPGHTFLFRVAGAGGWNVNLPYQLTLGGPEGLRGYEREDFPGAQRLLFTLEDRIYLAWPFPDLVDFGLTFFADAGRMWAGDVPFGQDSKWRASVGGGVRLGFPAGTRGVVRIDVAQPIRSGAGVDDLILRVSLRDLVGLAGGFEDSQLRRSRRVTVGPDFFLPRRR